jgi:hypothetical protein
MALPGPWARAWPGPGWTVMELAGRLAQQHAQELKDVLRLPGDQAKQAPQLQGARSSPPQHPHHQHQHQHQHH